MPKSSGYTLVTDTHDGAQGADGQFERTVYQNVEDQPDYPSGEAPTGWTFEPTESNSQRWKSIAPFNDGNTTINPEVSEITFSGSTAGVTFIPAEAEVTELGITAGIPGGTSGFEPDAATQETTVIEFGGTTGDAFASFSDVAPEVDADKLLRNVNFGGGVYVAVGEQPGSSEGGLIFTSPDAINWTQRTSPVLDKTLNDVAYGVVDVMGTPTPTWFAVGDTSTLITSTDSAETWNAVTGHGISGNPQAIRFGNGLWVATTFGTGTVWTSTNGVGAWTNEPTAAPLAFGLEFVPGVDDANGLFVAVGNSGSIYTSTGDTKGSMGWSPQTSNVGGQLRSVAHDNGLWLAVGGGGVITTSSNGTSWASASQSGGTLHGAVIANGSYFAFGDSGLFRDSTNGTDWTTRTSMTTPPLFTSESLRGGSFRNDQLIFVGGNTSNGVIFTPAGEGSTFTIDGDNSQFPNGPVTFNLGSALPITEMRNEVRDLINNSTEIDDLTATASGAGNDRITIISDVGGAFSNILVDISGGGDATAVSRFIDHIDGTDIDGALNAQTRLVFSGESASLTPGPDTFSQASGTGTEFFEQVYFADDKWVGVADEGGIFVSTTGSSGPFTAATVPTVGADRRVYDIAYDGTGRWVAVCEKLSSGTARTQIWTTTDPAGTWVQAGDTNLDSMDSGETMAGVTHDGTSWWAVGNDGVIISALDPTADYTDTTNGWITQARHGTANQITNRQFRNITFADGVYVVTGRLTNTESPNVGTILTSTTGQAGTWTHRTAHGYLADFWSTTFANGTWVITASAEPGEVSSSIVVTKDITSTNTADWATVSSTYSTNTTDSAFHNGVWYVTSDVTPNKYMKGTYADPTDPDSDLTWDADNNTDSGISQQVNGCFSNGTDLVFAGGGGTMLTVTANLGAGSVFTINGDSSEFTGGSINTSFTDLSDSDSMASQAADFINDPANGVTGLNIFAVGDQLQLDSTTTGTRDQIQVSVTGGTAGVTPNRDAGFAGNGVVSSTFEITPAGNHNLEKVTTLTFTGIPETGTYTINVDGEENDADVDTTISATPQSLEQFATDVATQITLVSGYSATSDTDSAIVIITGTPDEGDYTVTTPSNPTLGITAAKVELTPSSITGSFPRERTPAQALVIIKAVFDNNLIGGYDVGTISGTTFSVTSQETGIEDELTFVITDGTAGNLVESTDVTNDGSESDSDGERDRWSTTINRVTYTGFFDDTVNDTTILDGGGQAAKQASDLNLEVAGPSPIFVATSTTTDMGVTGVLTITARDNGNQYDTTTSLTQGSSTLGLDSTANETPPVVIMDGRSIPNWGTPVQDGFRGSIGVDGARGPGRFSNEFFIDILDATETNPAIAGSRFDTDARAVIVAVLGAGANPADGDVVTISYQVTDDDNSLRTESGLFDLATISWQSFALTIDGNLLVNGTIVGDKLLAGTIKATQVELFPQDVGAGISNLRVNGSGEALNDADQTVAEWIAADAANTAENFVQASSATSRMVILSNKIEIYEGTTLRVELGELS